MAATNTTRFSDQQYQNWLKDTLSLLYLKEALEDIVDIDAIQFHQGLQKALGVFGAVPSTCSSCTQNSIIQDFRRRKWWMTCSLCDQWLQQIVQNHANQPLPSLHTENTDPQLWPTNPYEVFKCYMPYGCQQDQSAVEGNVLSILKLIQNCLHFSTCGRIGRLDLVDKLVEIRNSLLQSGNFLVADPKLKADMQTMLDFLRGLKALSGVEQNAVDVAIDKILQLKTNMLDVSFRELDLNALKQKQIALGNGLQSLKVELNNATSKTASTEDAVKTIQQDVGPTSAKVARMDIDIESLQREIHSADLTSTKLKATTTDTSTLREKKKQKLDVPGSLSTLDPKWTELYLQALREGKEKQRDVRLMIVGHEGVGKTTLGRNLMDIPIQDVETTNGIEVHVRTGLVEVDGTWKKTEPKIKDAKVGERIARIIEPVKKKDKHAPSNPPSADAFTETSTLEIKNEAEKEFPLDAKKALKTEMPQQPSVPREDKKKDLSITDQTIANVKQLIMVKQTQHNTNIDKTVSIWDFGGQFFFYATHQLFHSSGAIYLLVLDLSKGLDDMIDDGYPFTCNGAKGKTVRDFIKFWMHSIHTFASSETSAPPVILVGTHRDKIDGKKMSKEGHAENYFENIRKLFDKTPLSHHIQPQHFFLDNLRPEKNSFGDLRRNIIATAVELSSFNKEIPAKWIPLEQALCQIENKPYITFSEVCEMDSKSDVPIADVEMIRLFLMHHHFQGLLVYFNEEELQDYVILNPQWIIDAFKCIITSWRVFSKEPKLREMWQEFENTAILKNNLIEEVWEKNDETDFLADKELLLKVLVRLGILSQGRAYDEDTGKVEELDYFLVPSLLPMLKDESGMDTFLGNTTSTQMVIVFEFEHSYISPTIYYRTTAAAVGKWAIVKRCGTQQLYGNVGIYRLDRYSVGLVRLTDKTIELSVHNLYRKPVSCDIADIFRRFITKVIKKELNRFHCGIETKITTTFRCSCSKLGTEQEYVITEELKGNDSLPCPVTFSHIIDGTFAYREWFVDADTFVQRNRQVLETKIGDREIGQISRAIGRNWELLGMDLGISKVKLEQIQMDHPFSCALQIRYMLLTWKERAAYGATLQVLYDKMKDNPEVSIDWDKIRDVIDSRLSQR